MDKFRDGRETRIGGERERWREREGVKKERKNLEKVQSFHSINYPGPVFSLKR